MVLIFWEIHVSNCAISIAKFQGEEQELLELRSELESLRDAQAAGTQKWGPFVGNPTKPSWCLELIEIS
jgi:hypothetical protein